MLAVRVGALGDTILCLPALGVLRETVGPSGGVELLGRFPQARLALSARYATAVHDVDRGPFRYFFSEPEGEASLDDASLRRFVSGFDLVVAWAKLPRLAELAPVRLEAEPYPPRGVHASDHASDLLRQGGIVAPSGAAPTIEPDETAREAAHRWACDSGLGSDYVAIHPSSGSREKNWPAERFADLAGRVRRSGRDVLWIQGEADEEVVSPLSSAVPGAVARGLGLDVLGAVLAGASLYVGNDSGVSHLAAAVGAPVIAIFGPTDEARWAPRGRVIVVRIQLLAGELWGIANSRFVVH